MGMMFFSHEKRKNVHFLFQDEACNRKECTAYMSQLAASVDVVDAAVIKVCEYLNMVVDEIPWSDRLNRYNHNPHFPYLVTHFTDSMPISLIGGALSHILFNPKYAGPIWKLAVAVDHFGNIVWIGPLMPSTTPDVTMWDKYDPSRKLGLFKDLRWGIMMVHKGRLHSNTPFIGRRPGSYEMRKRGYMGVIMLVLSTYLLGVGVGKRLGAPPPRSCMANVQCKGVFCADVLNP